MTLSHSTKYILIPYLREGLDWTDRISSRAGSAGTERFVELGPTIRTIGGWDNPGKCIGAPWGPNFSDVTFYQPIQRREEVHSKRAWSRTEVDIQSTSISGSKD